MLRQMHRHFKEVVMIQFIKTQDPENKFDVSEVIFKLSNDSSYNDLIQEFERFLLACSYNFKGKLEMVEGEE